MYVLTGWSTSLVDSGFGKDVLRNGGGKALRHLSHRMVETSLLASPEIVDIAIYWDLYVGRHDSVLRERLETLGIKDPDIDLIRFLKCCLETWVARNSKKEIIDANSERATFESYNARMGSQLRCEICGYHFREEDLTSKRKAIAEEFALQLAHDFHPKRFEDQFKPISSKRKDRYYTSLEMDHITPQAGLGGSNSSNLAITCRMCNLGKSAFVYPYEGVSTVVAHSLVTTYHGISPDSGAVIPAVVGCLRQSDGICGVSGVDISKAELTVRFRKNSRWMVPWNLEAVCYDVEES